MSQFLHQWGQQILAWRPLENSKSLQIIVASLAFITGLLVWFSHGQTFELPALQQLYRALPQSWSPNVKTWLGFLFANSLSTLSLWLFTRVALQIGLGITTTFFLFLLLNFNPEFKSVRLDISMMQIVIVLWTLSIYWFLRYYQHHLYRAFLLWAACLWIAALIEPWTWLWVLGLPLCFLFWPGTGRWWQRGIERGKFLIVYYLLAALLIMLVPLIHQQVFLQFQEMTQRIERAMSDISLFISGDRGFDLAGYDAFVIALVLVVINALKNAGFLILLVVWFAMRHRYSAVLPGRVWLFFAYNLGFAALVGALSLLYLGHLHNDLLYTPITMLILWMSASAVFHLYQRWRAQRIAPQHRLLTVWLLVAYAIASIIQFGPSQDYLRDAGLWAADNAPGKIWSNHYASLFYVGESPIAGQSAQYVRINQDRLPADFAHGDVLLYQVGRKQQPAAIIDRLSTQTVFRNQRGDTVYVLTLSDRAP
ncbi:hypothetical protein L0B52_08665 [Suttonella sp. R2A3]|uniref:hypothetical protein n=1 Tax=Suttonella sp. R2A3 TaxID=2908648 RepID=UPI001F1F8192|nr:hypothetical protein [Suttonella sp. R2A3]UJF24392.1 hypothetical protein L0B52_08665 [Suttonella sp. R2A3]